MSLRKISAQLSQTEEGFTLMELVIVVAIIGILVAIAIPTFGAIQHTADGDAMKNNSKALFNTAHAEIIQRGGSFTYTPANHALAQDVMYEVTDKWDAENGLDGRWGMSPSLATSYADGEIYLCFSTFKNTDSSEAFARGYGNYELGCQDEG